MQRSERACVDRTVPPSLQCAAYPGSGSVKRKSGLNFETSLQALEALVERMERGDLTLEESLLQFEQGMILIKSCQHALQAAEQKVRILTEGPTGETLADFAQLEGAPAPADEEEDEED